MRPLLICLLFHALPLAAQQPDLSVVFVSDPDGNAMHGAYATPIAAQALLSKTKAPAWTVQMHFTVSEDHPYSPHEIGTHKMWTLNADTVRDGRRRHLRFNIIDCWCRDQYLLVIQDSDTMRVDMPNDVDTRGHLVHKRVARSGLVPSPEVIRFRPGHFRFEALAQDSRMQEVEQRLTQNLIRESEKHDAGSTRKVEHVGGPTEAMPVRERPSARREVELVELRGDVAVLRLWGNVMLTGACGGIMPLMAMEVMGNNGWEELVPMPEVQLDCGPSSEEANGHVLSIPLVEWMRTHGRSAMPGRYCLRFRFADGAVRWTKAFSLE